MPLNTNGLNAAATGVSNAAAYVSLHSALPDATGSNETTAARKAAAWQGAGATRDLVSTLSFTGGAASGPVTHAGLWSAASGGTFYGSIALTGDTTFNAAGEYNVTELTITIS